MKKGKELMDKVAYRVDNTVTVLMIVYIIVWIIVAK